MSAKTDQSIQAKVEDAGGVFVSANDPKALADWYKDTLGLELTLNADNGDYYVLFSRGASAPEFVFAIKPAKAKLSTEKNQFTINFRIGDFDSFIKRLKAKGVALERTQEDDYGRFGTIKDLEGNPIEFWQPKQS